MRIISILDVYCSHLIQNAEHMIYYCSTVTEKKITRKVWKTISDIGYMPLMITTCALGMC
jgi:hypothetical protein